MTDRERMNVMFDKMHEKMVRIIEKFESGAVMMCRWIPVTERLPSKEFDWVLVACKLVPEGEYGVPHIAELRHGVWYTDCYEVPLESAGTKVTHWMPLPEPPKEGAE